jgi:hypothetical protein
MFRCRRWLSSEELAVQVVGHLFGIVVSGGSSLEPVSWRIPVGISLGITSRQRQAERIREEHILLWRNTWIIIPQLESIMWSSHRIEGSSYSAEVLGDCEDKSEGILQG